MGEQTTETSQQELLQNTHSVATSILRLIPWVTVFLVKRNSINLIVAVIGFIPLLPVQIPNPIG
jgi:hypothetical protein